MLSHWCEACFFGVLLGASMLTHEACFYERDVALMATYVITLRARGTDVRGLRLVFKRLLRQHQLRCASVREGDDRLRQERRRVDR